MLLPPDLLEAKGSTAQRFFGNVASERGLFCILGGTVSLIFSDCTPGTRPDELVDAVGVVT